MEPNEPRRARRRPLLALVALGLLAVVGGLAAESRAEQARAYDQVEARFVDRIHLAADYVHTHLDEMRHRQTAYARNHLTGAEVSPREFDATVAAFGFEAAVLLDGEGRVLAVSPMAPGLMGNRVADRYDHLSQAVAGRDAVSDVVLSAAKKSPIVAVAVPYETAGGRRVISGGYQLSSTPLAGFLKASSSLPGRQLYLVDGAGRVITSTEEQDQARPGFGEQAPALDAAPLGTSTAIHQGTAHLVIAVPIEATRWRLVAAVPTAELHEPVSGTGQMLSALVLASAVMAALVFVLLTGVWRQRDHLRLVSRTDQLTGLANRRWAEDVMASSAAASERTGQPWAVVMIDVDRFKSVNDRLGHSGGDRVLRTIASVLQRQSRRSELCARWGGEEFLVVMQDTDLDSAVVAGKRFAAGVRDTAMADRTVTVSVGVAAAAGGDADALVDRADRALYDAKHQGRDQVVAAPPFQAGQPPAIVSC